MDYEKSTIREIKWIPEILLQMKINQKLVEQKNMKVKFHDISTLRQKNINGMCFDLASINTSIPAEELIQMVQNALKNDQRNSNEKEGIKILFYGISGGGKTRLARHIADVLDKRIISKNVSDILGKYVGETEHNIASAFSEAKLCDKVLIFDEADSFLSSRADANQTWERSQVNEFLMQLENFSGICICTTNFKEIMDSAMNRRFHIMVEFKPLSEDGIHRLLKCYFTDLEFNDSDIRKIFNYQSAVPGDFGKLKSKLRFMDFEKIDSSFIVNELCQIQEEKSSGSRHIGF